MNNKKSAIFLTSFFLFLALLFSGCGKNVDKVNADSETNSLDVISENAVTDISVDISEEKGTISTDTSTDVEDLQATTLSIDDTMLGTYIYNSDDEIEERIFEIFRISDKYYAEYSGVYDYASAELLINNRETTDDGIIYNVTFYAFSGFSFMGEYWGEGNDCQIKVLSNGDIILGENPLFLNNDDILLSRQDGLYIHESSSNPSRNVDCPEVVGCWGCISARDGIEHEITMFIMEDGSFKAVNKVNEFPSEIYVGKYEVKFNENEIIGSILCERVGYGGMPYEWVLMYDEEQQSPYVYSEYMFAEPFTFKEDEIKLPFVKYDTTYKSNILPGPGSRSVDLKNMFDEFIGLEVEEDNSLENNYEELIGKELLEDILSKAKSYTKAPIVEVESITEGSEGLLVTIHCYELINSEEIEHTSTFDWIYYEVETGKYYDFFEDEIDMSLY